MSNIIIKIANPNGTYLKVTNLQSTDISNEDKIYVAVDTEIELTDITKADEKNHYRVSLLEPELGKYTYYLYSPHVVITKSDDPDYVVNTPKSVIVANSLNQAKVNFINSQYSPFVQKQINSLVRYSPTGNIDLDTSCIYFSQRDNDVMPNRTCNSSSNAMYLNWLQRACGQSKVLTDDDVFVKSVLKRGDTIYHGVITQTLKAYGFNTIWDDDGDINKLKQLVLAGFVVPVNILHRGTRTNPRGGHIICLVGYRQSGDWICMDPYGTLDSGYTNRNGKNAFISRADFQSRWQGGYRYLS